MNPEDLDQEQIDLLISLGVIPDEMGALDAQMAEAQAIRNRTGPEGREAGRTFVAANPLEHLGDFMQKRKAGKEIEDLRGQQDILRGTQKAGRKEFWEAMMRKRPEASPLLPPEGEEGAY